MRRCVVTGAAGYVAGFVILELEKSSSLTLGARGNLETSHRLILGDLMSEAYCRRLVEGADVVVHIAGIPEPRPGTFEINVMSTYRLLEAAQAEGVRRFVFASSNCVYGHCYRECEQPFMPPYLPIDEGHPCEPTDDYGLSKVACEALLLRRARASGMEVAALRLAWVWGDRERAWWREHGRNDEGKFADCFWSYVDAGDAARAFRATVEVERLERALVCNINANDTFALDDSTVNARRFLPHLEDRAEELKGRQSFFSSERARSALGWEPERGFATAEAVL